MPTLLSVQVGMPADHDADKISNKPWRSGIFKFPVAGRVWLGTLNLEGDGQEDLKNHGGPYRAVLAYSADHYPAWREMLDCPDLPYGAFGENFTISGSNEETVCIGDVYAVGEARVQVAQPRAPCWKLARRWGIKALTAWVDEKAQGGWYYRVLQEGYVGAGDRIERLEHPHPDYPVAKVYKLIKKRIEDPPAVAVLSEMEALSDGWRETFAQWVEERL